MPREIIPDQTERKGPPEVYVSLRDLIGLQHEAHGFSFLPRYAIQSLLSGRHRSRLRGRGLDFDEVRQYVSGDDIRNIDWKVTARVGTTHTKVFTEERERPVLIVVDQSSSMFFGSRRYIKSVVAAHLAALGAWRTLEVSDRVGGIVFGDRELDHVTPKRNRKSVQQLLSLVTDKNQALGPGKEALQENMLERSIRLAEQTTNHDFLVVVISDFQQLNPNILKAMIRISVHNDVIAAQVSDPLEQELPGANLVLSDGIYQTALEYKSRSRDIFQEHRAEKQEQLAVQLHRYGIPLLSFNTGEPASTQLRNVMGGSAGKRRKR